MVSAEAFPQEPLVVQVFPHGHSNSNSSNKNNKNLKNTSDRTTFSQRVTIRDADKHEATAMLVGDAKEQITGACVVLVNGYVTSQVNPGNADPILFLANVIVVSHKIPPSAAAVGVTRNNNDRWHHSANDRIPGGKVHEFFKAHAHFLTNESLSGQSSQWSSPWTSDLPLPRVTDSMDQLVSQFIERDHAMHTLWHQQQQSTTTISSSQQHYMAALAEFQASQLDRQKVSLHSHCGRAASATDVAKLTGQHQAALVRACGYSTNSSSSSSSSSSSTDTNNQITKTAATKSTPTEPDSNVPSSLEDDARYPATLTRDILCQWHGVLCGNGLQADAGQLRRKNVRVGKTNFQPADTIAATLDELLTALDTIQNRLLYSSRNHQRNHHRNQQDGEVLSTGRAAATFAAAVFFAIVDTHAFSDGNGRLGRLAANWALRRAGIPFCIHLFATSVQRKEYTTATILTRRNLYLQERGNVDSSAMIEALRLAGGLGPLVDLFLERLAKTITEFNNLFQEKSSLVMEEADAKAARRYREKAATGSCIICFDEKPNIATLCCGKAIHLNCMAEWLSTKNTCPQCRADMPRLPPRLRAPERHPDDQQPALAIDPAIYVPSDGEGDETTSSTVFMDDTTDMTETGSMHLDEAIARAILPAVPDHETTSVDEDETNSTTAVSMDAEQTTSSDVDDDTTTEQYVQAQADALPPFCVYGNCHNRSARDCSNTACGRCCVSLGRYNCERHNC